MAKFLCVCGEVIRTSGDVPNPGELRILADADFYTDPESEDPTDALYRRSTIAYRCPASGHLWIFWEGFDNPPSLYRFEKGGYAET